MEDFQHVGQNKFGLSDSVENLNHLYIGNAKIKAPPHSMAWVVVPESPHMCYYVRGSGKNTRISVYSRFF